jgi:hypothetical protein
MDDVLYVDSLIPFIKLVEHLQSEFSHSLLSELSSKCHAISRCCKGDGAGLLSGGIIDMFITSFLCSRLTNCKSFHNGESDLKINDISLSLKKISGKSSIALNWSKNKSVSEPNKEWFTCDMMIINLKTEQWWKKENPPKENQTDVTTCTSIKTKTIPAGIYFIPKQYCTEIVLSSNNKTNTLINTEELYKMLNYSIIHNYMVPLPEPDLAVTFIIENAFL